MENKTKMLFTTFSKKNDALEFAEKMIKLKLASCVQLIPEITSIYSWNGKVNKNEEFLILIKYNQSRESILLNFLGDNHPYEIPEVAVVDFTIKSKKYKRWFFEK
tara:strand:+ start:2186 stop:2500 length:315 start_codon:yes stop_codon:yes gene_type:complete